MVQNFVAATVLNIDDIKNQLRKASSTINVFRSNRDVVPVKLRAISVTDQDIGDHFVLDHPTNGIIDSSVLELDTGLGVSSNVVTTWLNNTVKEFLYVDSFIDSSLTTASTGTDSVVFDDGEEFVSASLTNGLGSLVGATFLSSANLEGSGSLSYFLSASESGAVEGVWYPISEGVSSVLADSGVSGTNSASLKYSGSSASDGLMGYWPLSGDAIDESANGNDGTLSTGTVIDYFDSTTAFISGGANTVVSYNDTTYLYGDGSLEVTTDIALTTQDIVINATVSSLDLTDKILTFYLYIRDATALAKLREGTYGIFYLFTDASNFDRHSLYKDDLSIGWNIVRIDCNNPTGSPTGLPDIGNINSMRLIFENLVGDAPRQFLPGEFLLNYLQHGAPVKGVDHLGGDSGSLFFSGGRYYGGSSYVGDNVNVIITPTPAQLDYTDDFTMGLWFKVHPDHVSVIGNNTGLYGYGFSVCMMLSSNAQYLTAGIRAGSTSQSVSSIAALTYGQWYRAVFVHRASDRRISLYLNGVLQNSSITTELFDTTTATLNIGERVLNSNVQNFGGWVAETFIHKGHDWDANDVLDDYTNGLIHKWNDPIDTADDNSIRINGITQYHMTTPVTISRTAGAISWRAYITQSMIDNGFVFFSSGWKSGNNLVVFCNNGSANSFIYYETNINGDGRVWTTPSGFTTGWHHFAMSWEDSVCTLYVDGESQGTGNALSGGITADLVGIDEIGNQGYDYNYGSISWTKMKDVRFYPDSSLSQEDVTWQYNGGSVQTLPTTYKWEAVTLGTPHTFTYSGSTLRYKITASGSATLNFLDSTNKRIPLVVNYQL